VSPNEQSIDPLSSSEISEFQQNDLQSHDFLMQSTVRIGGIVGFQSGPIEYLLLGAVGPFSFLVIQLEVRILEHCYIAPQPDQSQVRLVPINPSIDRWDSVH
jgi:hypothetical protein